MPKAPAFQFYPKQYVADNNVQAMEWDARGMYVHLLCMAWQENPPGSIPNDDAVIRRWLNLSHDTEQDLRTWRRVRSQIMAAFTLRDGRWFQAGLCETWERMQRRSQSSTNNVRKRYQHHVEEVVNAVDLKKVKEDSEIGIDFATSKVFLEVGLAGDRQRILVQDAVNACVHDRQCSFAEAADYLIGIWEEYFSKPREFKKGVFKFFSEGLWKPNQIQEWRNGARKDGARIDLTKHANPQCSNCFGSGYRKSYSAPGGEEPCECAAPDATWRDIQNRESHSTAKAGARAT